MGLKWLSPCNELMYNGETTSNIKSHRMLPADRRTGELTRRTPGHHRAPPLRSRVAAAGP